MISQRFFSRDLSPRLHTHKRNLVSVWIEIEDYMIQHGGAHDNFATLTVSISSTFKYIFEVKILKETFSCPCKLLTIHIYVYVYNSQLKIS